MSGENNLQDPYQFVTVFTPNKSMNNIPKYFLFNENPNELDCEDSYDYDIDISDEDKQKKTNQKDKEQGIDSNRQDHKEEDMEVDHNKILEVLCRPKEIVASSIQKIENPKTFSQDQESKGLTLEEGNACIICEKSGAKVRCVLGCNRSFHMV